MKKADRLTICANDRDDRWVHMIYACEHGVLHLSVSGFIHLNVCIQSTGVNGTINYPMCLCEDTGRNCNCKMCRTRSKTYV